MEARKLRGAAIAKAGGIRQRAEHLWLVPSQSHSGNWLVDYDNEDGVPTCTCPDFADRWCFCKHIFAIEITERRIAMPDEAPPQKKYTQDWTAYNMAQTNEEPHVKSLMFGLCQGIVTPPQEGRGRPCKPLGDMIFASAMKVYTGKSGRRAQAEIDRCHEEGLISGPIRYNTISLYMRDPALTPILRLLVQESAAPLSDVESAVLESVVAVDGTGFGTSVHDRYFVNKHGTKTQKKAQGKRNFIRAHAACGVNTQICTDLIVTKSKGKGTGESTQFPLLLDGTSKHFDLTEVLADKAYSSQKNLQAVANLGAVPWIPYRDGTTAKTGPKIWRDMFYHFRCHEDRFKEHYHQRSNVEAMFNMVKSKFGGSVRSKSWEAQVNEVYLKFIIHNIVVLTHAIYEHGLVPTFWKDGDTDEGAG